MIFLAPTSLDAPPEILRSNNLMSLEPPITSVIAIDPIEFT